MNWRNNIKMTPEHEKRVLGLREAGCLCSPPLLGKNGKLIRCRICNIKIDDPVKSEETLPEDERWWK